MIKSLKDLERVALLVRYHRPQQFAWRVLRRAQGMWERAGIGVASSSRAAGFREGAEGVLVQMAERRVGLWPARTDPEWLAGIARGRFCFLNECRGLSGEQRVASGEERNGEGNRPIVLRGLGKIGTVPGREGVSPHFPEPKWGQTPARQLGQSPQAVTIDWRPEMPQLWRFHLQCHEYLLELAAHRSAAEAWAVVAAWLGDPAHQCPAPGADAWHPFCISRRLPVWLMLAASAPPPEALAGAFWSSVAVQAWWLRRHLEWDLGGNHLLENLRALALVTFLVDDAKVASGEWLVARIREQLTEQVLPSGEHIERAPTYHAVMLLAVQEMGAVLEFGRQTSAQDVFAVAERMATWLGGIVHPDGQVPLFGDSALDETPAPGQLCRAAGAPIESSREGAARVGDSWCWRSQTGDFLIVDGGPAACNQLPAHGHADLLALEASIASQRIFVDGGVFDYEDSAMRRYCRGTSAHNTVQIDGEDHCDVWSKFRMGRRGKPIYAEAGCQPPFCWFAAAPDAYAFLGVPWTGRFVAAAPGPIWVIVDWIVASERHEPVSRLRLHPEVVLKTLDDENVSLTIGAADQPDRTYQLSLLGDAELGSEAGWYCPNFGDRQAIQVVTGRRRGHGRQWLGWVLQPIGAQSELGIAFRQDALDVRLPNGQEVAVQIK